MDRSGAEMDGEPRLWFVFREGRILAREEPREGSPNGTLGVPRVAPEALGLEPGFRREVGELEGLSCWAVEVDDGAGAPEGFAFRELRGMLLGVDEELFLMAGRAKQVVVWNANHRFCGRCGSGTMVREEELARKCPTCGLLHYPRLSPAAIVLVTRGDRMLLARSPGFPPGMYSALAGFVEPGESIERTIRREVREEVGVEVEGIRYFGSQPWPFPNSLMLGFTAGHAGGELRPEPGEIEDAGWFGAEELPDLPPKVSIARAMIEAFVAERGPGAGG